MITVVATLLLLLVSLQEPVSTVRSAQPDPGITGYVLTPDGEQVAGGIVVAQSDMMSRTVSILSTGRFRVVPMRSGVHQLAVSVPGLAPYRVIVSVPASRSVRLPVIRLVAGAHFRVRLVTPGGEPIIAPQLRRRLFDVSSARIFAALGDRISEPAVRDGAILIGSLPRSLMTVALDMPLFAQTRLPDVNVRDAAAIVDGGTVTIQQPGAVLHVDVVDGAGGGAGPRCPPRGHSSAIAARLSDHTNEPAGTRDVRPPRSRTVPRDVERERPLCERVARDLARRAGRGQRYSCDTAGRRRSCDVPHHNAAWARACRSGVGAAAAAITVSVSRNVIRMPRRDGRGRTRHADEFPAGAGARRRASGELDLHPSGRGSARRPRREMTRPFQFVDRAGR